MSVRRKFAADVAGFYIRRLCRMSRVAWRTNKSNKGTKRNPQKYKEKLTETQRGSHKATETKRQSSHGGVEQCPIVHDTMSSH